MTAREMEIIDETEIFTEALIASVALGELTVDQVNLQLKYGLAYIEARGTDNVEVELLIAAVALKRVNERIASRSLLTRRPAAEDVRLWEIHSKVA